MKKIVYYFIMAAGTIQLIRFVYYLVFGVD